jgi:hypothetical protein
MEYPKDRKTAQAQGAPHYFTGEPCKRGHIAPRETKGNCTACRKEDSDKVQEERARYFAQYNKSAAGVKAKKEYYARNKELVIARAVARPQADKNRYKKQWKDTHPAHVTADRKNRRRKHRDASPAWLTPVDKASMRELYRMAMQLTKTTGTPYVVDHIVPLRHPLVCGMHVPWNLQVMTRGENLKKSNKVDGLWSPVV